MTAVRLSPEQLSDLADLIAERLAARQAGEVIDAAELAKRLGVSRDCVYANAGQLGAMKLGNGDRPRLLFRWPGALERLTDEEQTSAPVEPPKRRRRRKAPTTDLLPIKGATV